MRLPLTIRVLFHAVRSIWVAGILAISAWVGLADATPEERTALGAQIGTQRPDGLIQMRVARAMVHFAPDRAARMLNEATNGDISVELAGMLLRDMAKGPAARSQAFEAITANAPTGSDRPQTGDGAKFVRVDRP